MSSTVADLSTTSDLSAASCDHDTQCAGSQCGGQVCQWPAHRCVNAGTDPSGSDGWCNTDADCKCASQGATCNTATFHCSTTLPTGTDKSSGCEIGRATTPSATLLLFVILALLALRRRRA
jgi:MYXO-CTERM domain-containing protein